MIKNSLFDYITIRIAISALRLIAPVSIIYVPCGFRNLLGVQWTYNVPLTLYATAEAVFYFLVYLPRRRKLQAPPVHPPPSLTRTQRQRIFDKCIEAGTIHSSLSSSSTHELPAQVHNKPYPTGWFLPKDTTPTRKDAIDWLLWALFSTSRETGLVDLEDESLRDEMDGYIDRIEKALGRKLEMSPSDEIEESVEEEEDRRPRTDEETGRQREASRRKAKADAKGMRSMRITLDPVQMLHRPLLWYFIVCMVDTYTSIFLLSLGFKHYTPRTREHRICFPPRLILSCVSQYAPPGVVVPYWYRPHRSRSRMPVVFLHGIGIGLYPYIPFIRKLYPADSSASASNADPDGDVGVLLPELLPISMHMTKLSVPPRAEMLRSLDLILEHLKATDCSPSQEQLQECVQGREQEQERYRDEHSPLLPASSSIPSSSSSSSSSLSTSLPSYASLAPSHRSSFTDTTPPRDSNQDTGTASMSNMGWDKVVLVAHSYGTFVAGWIVRMCVDVDLIGLGDGEYTPTTSSIGETSQTGEPAQIAEAVESPASLARKIAHVVLVDPIPILLSDPTVAHNFLYREPGSVCPVMLGGASTGGRPFKHGSNGNEKEKEKSAWYSSAAAWQLWYFASRDADVARTLCRAFFWAEGGVWREEVGGFVCGAVGASDAVDDSTGEQSQARRGRERGQTGRNMAVVLGGMDQIVPSEAIRRYLTREERWTDRWAVRGSAVNGDTATDVKTGMERRQEEEEEVDRILNDQPSHSPTSAPATGSEATRQDGEGTLEVLFNPILDHAVIFDEERYTEPLVEVVKRYTRER